MLIEKGSLFSFSLYSEYSEKGKVMLNKKGKIPPLETRGGGGEL